MAPLPEPMHAAAPIIIPPAPAGYPVAAAPMQIGDLQPILEQAGLTLVQTEPLKLADVLARFEREPRPVRVPRERPVLPPLDAGPLVQIETRPAAQQKPH
jgi:ribonuclease E